MSSNENNLRILSIGLDAVSRAAVEKVLDKGSSWKEMPPDLEQVLELPSENPPHVILCGPPQEGVSAAEFGQALSMQFSGVPVFYITSARAGFDRKNFQKNGFTDAFLVPIDTPVMEAVVREAVATATKGAVKAYRPVKLVDITPGVVLEFDTYIHLPTNKKHIHYTGAGMEITDDQAARLKKKALTEMHVTHDQIQKFYQFTANQLKKLEGDGALSETERRERIQTAIRDLMGGIFNDSTKEASTTHGKQVVADCQEIVKAYIVGGGVGKKGGSEGKSTWYEKLLNATGKNDSSYSHASNVATFAVLFSIGTGIGKPDDMGIAAILHDIGLADIPIEIQAKPESARTKEEQDIYKTHVEKTLILIRDRKLIVSEAVLKMIGQHHERFSGGGYPKGKGGKQFADESQILALADEFDYLMTGTGGEKGMSPAEALRHLIRSNLIEQRYNPEIIAKIKGLFPEVEASAQAA